MSHEHTRSNPLATLFTLAVVIFVGAGIAAYAMGWLSFRQTDDSAIMEVQTREIKQAADKAVDKTEDLIHETGEALQDAGKSLTKPASDDGDKDSAAQSTDTTYAPNAASTQAAMLQS